MNRNCRALVMIATSVFASCVSAKVPSAEDEVLKEQELRGLLQKAVIELNAPDSQGVDRAQAALIVASGLSADDARILDGLGAVAYRRGDLKKATEYFQSAIQRDENYDRPYAHLALVAERNRDYLAARQLLQIAVTKNPLNYRAHNNLGALLFNHPSDKAQPTMQAKEEFLKAKEIVWNTKDKTLTQNLSLK